MQLVSPIIAFIISIGMTTAPKSHELWISPDKYLISLDDPLTAHIRIGQKFEGPSFPYVEMNFKQFEIFNGAASMPVKGRIGDSPALNRPSSAGKVDHSGLNIIAYETTANSVTYSDFEKFRNFVTHKGYPELVDRHKERGLQESGFKERYFRYAKSLVAVGDGKGEDKRLGLEIEIVALKNPYTDDLSGGFPVQVFYQGQPRANAQIEVFERGGIQMETNAKDMPRDVGVATYQTDSLGQAIIPVRKGREYLVDSVVIRPLEPAINSTESSNPPVWESLWASLTLEIPAGGK